MANLSPIQFQATSTPSVGEFSASSQEENSGNFIGELMEALDLQEASHPAEKPLEEQDALNPQGDAPGLAVLQILPEAAIQALPVAAKIASSESVPTPTPLVDQSMAAGIVDPQAWMSASGSPMQAQTPLQAGQKPEVNANASQDLDAVEPLAMRPADVTEKTVATTPLSAVTHDASMALSPPEQASVNAPEVLRQPSINLMPSPTADAQTEMQQSNLLPQSVTQGPTAPQPATQMLAGASISTALAPGQMAAPRRLADLEDRTALTTELLTPIRSEPATPPASTQTVVDPGTTAVAREASVIAPQNVEVAGDVTPTQASTARQSQVVSKADLVIPSHTLVAQDPNGVIAVLSDDKAKTPLAGITPATSTSMPTVSVSGTPVESVPMPPAQALVTHKESTSAKSQDAQSVETTESADSSGATALALTLSSTTQAVSGDDLSSWGRSNERQDVQTSFTSTLMGQFAIPSHQGHAHQVFEPSTAPAPLEPHQVQLDSGEVKVEIIRLAKQGGGQVVMELTPPDQSKFKIDLKIDAQGVASLVVEGASDSTRSRLERGAEGLQQQFAEMGLALQLDMRQSQDSGAHRQSMQDLQTTLNQAPSLIKGSSHSVTTAQRVRATTEGQVHLYA